MERICGIEMPEKEIDIKKYYYESPRCKRVILIEAGPRGWSIIYADFPDMLFIPKKWKNNSVGTEVNLRDAYNTLIDLFPEAYEVPEPEKLPILGR